MLDRCCSWLLEFSFGFGNHIIRLVVLLPSEALAILDESRIVEITSVGPEIPRGIGLDHNQIVVLRDDLGELISRFCCGDSGIRIRLHWSEAHIRNRTRECRDDHLCPGRIDVRRQEREIHLHRRAIAGRFAGDQPPAAALWNEELEAAIEESRFPGLDHFDQPRRIIALGRFPDKITDNVLLSLAELRVLDRRIFKTGKDADAVSVAFLFFLFAFFFGSCLIRFEIELLLGYSHFGSLFTVTSTCKRERQPCALADFAA